MKVTLNIDDVTTESLKEMAHERRAEYPDDPPSFEEALDWVLMEVIQEAAVAFGWKKLKEEAGAAQAALPQA